jgi:hypothetical protein
MESWAGAIGLSPKLQAERTRNRGSIIIERTCFDYNRPTTQLHDLCLLQTIRPALGSAHFPIWYLPWESSTRNKAGHPYPARADVKNMWSYKSTPSWSAQGQFHSLPQDSESYLLPSQKPVYKNSIVTVFTRVICAPAYFAHPNF